MIYANEGAGTSGTI